MTGTGWEDPQEVLPSLLCAYRFFLSVPCAVCAQGALKDIPAPMGWEAGGPRDPVSKRKTQFSAPGAQSCLPHDLGDEPMLSRSCGGWPLSWDHKVLCVECNCGWMNLLVSK